MAVLGWQHEAPLLHLASRSSNIPIHMVTAATHKLE